MTRPEGTHRILADAMLERLARWLRVLGVDAASAAPDEGDAAIARRARNEGRIVLTRDRRLADDIGPRAAVLVQSDRPLQQLRDVIERLSIPLTGELFTRCLVCNVALDGTEADRHCPACGRAYWEGVHTRRMRAALARTFGEALPDHVLSDATARRPDMTDA